MKKQIILMASFLFMVSCNSSKPMENANMNIIGAFSSLEKGNIGLDSIDVKGEKCNEIKKDEAECEVQTVTLKLGQDTNFNEESGVIKSIVSGIIPNEFTHKKGETITLSGKFKLQMGTVGSGVKFKSWNLRNIELKKI
jgi:hypothetical protein